MSGNVISSAPSDNVYVDIVDIEVRNARNKKINEFNDLFNDRRGNYYRL